MKNLITFLLVFSIPQFGQVQTNDAAEINAWYKGLPTWDSDLQAYNVGCLKEGSSYVISRTNIHGMPPGWVVQLINIPDYFKAGFINDTSMDISKYIHTGKEDQIFTYGFSENRFGKKIVVTFYPDMEAYKDQFNAPKSRYTKHFHYVRTRLLSTWGLYNQWEFKLIE